MTKQTTIILTLVVLALAAYAGEWYLNKRSARIADRATAPTRMAESMPTAPTQTSATPAQATAPAVAATPIPSGKKPAVSGAFVPTGILHTAEGSVVVSESGDSVQIRLSEDFAVSDAPDMYVWLYPAGSDEKTATVRHLDLGILKKNSGPATYQVSKAEFDMYGGTVVIWCKEFSVEIARAVLKSNN
jgi:hypothetical protein